MDGSWPELPQRQCSGSVLLAHLSCLGSPGIFDGYPEEAGTMRERRLMNLAPEKGSGICE